MTRPTPAQALATLASEAAFLEGHYGHTATWARVQSNGQVTFLAFKDGRQMAVPVSLEAIDRALLTDEGLTELRADLIAEFNKQMEQ